MPGPIIGAFADQRVEGAPIPGVDGLVPTVQILEDDADAPGCAGVPHVAEVGQRLFNACVGFRGGGPSGVLRETGSGRASGRVKVADAHVVQEDVVETARAQSAADEVGMDVDDRHLGQRGFQFNGCG